MCILLKFDYAKVCVSNLCFSKVFEEKPLGVVGSTPPPPPPTLVQEGLTHSAEHNFEIGYVEMYVEMFVQGYPRHNSGNYGVPVVKMLVKKKKKK